ncbi:hypothetical protein M081_5175 [Bacteroides fragilis str. 3998 T(B) 4]|nr:hypothetical protein M081_5175 [Bacteroides fragilis str. 3998 T(B) 4]
MCLIESYLFLHTININVVMSLFRMIKNDKQVIFHSLSWRVEKYIF